MTKNTEYDAQDDLHFLGNPQQITGMEVTSPDPGLSPGSIFDEEDVMSQIYHVLGMAQEDEGEEGGEMLEMPPEAPLDEGMMDEGMMEAPILG